MPSFRRTLTLIVSLPLALAACAGGSSGPTAPPALDSATLAVSSQSGQLVVFDYGCGDRLDLARIASEIDTTTRIAERQNPTVFGGGGTLQGFEVHARPSESSEDRCHGAPACFEPVGSSGRLHVWCGGGGVEHESAHALGWATHLPCWEIVYHSTNFRCEKTASMYGA